MPALGDQHRSNGTTATNPFDEPRLHMSEYTAQEIATLQSRLDRRLGPEYISSRPGAGGKKVHYLAAEKVIGLANEVFGFNGWSSSIQNVQIDFVEENPTTGKVRLGLSVIVRVTLRDGTFHEDVGYGQIENCPGKAAAFEKCKKEGTTDALKRALRTFGNVLGNCIYDKEFLQKVTKMKPETARWNPQNLHRHADYAPIKKEVHDDDNVRTTAGNANSSHTERDDEFGDVFDEADFDDNHVGNPDEIVLEAEPIRQQSHHNVQNRPTRIDPKVAPVNHSNTATPSKPPRPPDSDQAAHIERQRQLALERRNAALAGQKMQPPLNPSGATAINSRNAAAQVQQYDVPPQLSPRVPSQHFHQEDSPAAPIPPETSSEGPQGPLPPVGFYSARAIAPDGASVISGAGSHFNPHAESPSIRKTSGVDHNRSGKITRDSIVSKVIPAVEAKQSTNATGPTTRDFVNPSSDMNRKIGVPGGIRSPRTTGFRAPTFANKRAADGNAVSNHTGGGGQMNSLGTRQPLTDVGNTVGQPLHAASAGGGVEPELKRPRNIDPIGNGIENVKIEQRPMPGAT